MRAQTLFDKLWQAHNVRALDGGEDLLYIDRIFLHERTGGIALVSMAADGHKVRSPEHVFATMDHIVDTHPGRSDKTLMPGGTNFINITRRAAKEAGITLFDLDDERQGIVHVISPEQGIVLPGLTIVCPDSHTCTQGAFGALAFGIGSTQAEHAMATSTLRVSKPKSMLVHFSGILQKGVTAKDLILHLISRHGAAGGRGYAIEFGGAAIRALDMEARMTLCNMAVEFGAFTGMVAPDEKTYAWLKGRPYTPKGKAWDAALESWQKLATDTKAKFDRIIKVNVGAIAPTVSWGTSPAQSIALGENIPAPTSSEDKKSLTYMGLVAGVKITDLGVDAAFIGSCTNARLSDLRAAAAVLRGRRVHKNIRAICVPGSSSVKRAAEAEGLDVIFKEAGFEWRESGCSMCFYAGGEGFGNGKRVISTTNRNFEGRQGVGARTHLASPETVAASAVAGHICSVSNLEAHDG
ncbi:MAG: 3-isopropylmalate dehydratase large subunit [Robiginitomaculum sp.]|nr:MAG: 3-isopropylmalate dehydratase large subunit [Robiginitomaculum sp.]